MTTTENKAQIQHASAPACAFVLQHARLIERTARAWTTGNTMDPDDFAQELRLDLIATHNKWDPKRGAGASTWIYMRARAVSRHLVRKALRGRADLSLDGSGAITWRDDPDSPAPQIALPGGRRGHADRSEAQIELRALLAAATPTQRLACLSILRDWPKAELRARLGLSVAERDELVGEIRIPHRPARDRVDQENAI